MGLAMGCLLLSSKGVKSMEGVVSNEAPSQLHVQVEVGDPLLVGIQAGSNRSRPGAIGLSRGLAMVTFGSAVSIMMLGR